MGQGMQHMIDLLWQVTGQAVVAAVPFSSVHSPVSV